MGPDSSIVLCGQISMYDSDEEYPPPVSAAAQGHIDRHHIARNRYIVLNYLDEYGKALSDLCQMRATGRLKSHETWTTGFKNAPSAFVSMMHGGNTGKALVSCADPPLMQQALDTVRALLPSGVKGYLAAQFATEHAFAPSSRE
eukprot:m.44250 g.44250  ORF g.44250 m.44250 type:complete len:144 (+) comp15085_c0_seq5:159-590(+)